MFNKRFAESNKQFQEACKRVKLDTTAREASRWRRQTGLAWKKGRRKEVKG